MSDVATIGFAVDTSPVDRGTASLDRFTKGSEAAAAALAKMEAATSKAFAKVSPGMMGEAAGGPAGYNAHAVGIGAVSSALDGYTVSSEKATAAAGAHADVLRAGTEAHKAHGAAVGFNTSKLMELQHVGRSVVDVLASGGGIVRAFTVESGRLFEIFGPGIAKVRGAIEAFQAIPLAARVAGGSIAALGVTSLAALASYESAQDALVRSTNGIGRRSGASFGRLDTMAPQVAELAGLSTSEGYGLAARYNAAGVAPGVNASMIGMTRDYARLTGSSVGDAGDVLAKAVQDPIKGLGDLDKQLGFVDDRLRQQVDDLVRSGHLAQAQAVAMEALRKAVEGTTDTTWGLSKAMEGTGNFLSNTFSGIGHSLASSLGWNSDADKLDQARRSMTNLQRVDPLGNAGEIADLRAEIVRLEAATRADDAKAIERKRDAEATRLSGQAGDAVRSILPDNARARSATETLDILRQAMADPAIMAHMDPGTSQLLGRAYGNAAVVQGMSAPGLRQDQDYQLRLASNDAFSTGEKGIVEARRAELEVLRQTGDVLHAARSAQEALNIAIDKRNRDAADELDVAKDQRSLVGLTGLQRRLEELRLKFEGTGGVYGKDEVENSRALSDPTIKKDFTDAAKWTNSVSGFATALDGATARLAAFPAGGGPASSPYGGGPSPMTGGTTATAGGAALAAAPAAIQSMIADAAARTGISANVIAAIGQKENGYRLTGGTSMLGADGHPSSAWGFGQLTNGAAADVAHAVPGFSKYNPNTAVFGSAEYLKILMDRNHGNLGMALNAYGGTNDYAADIARRAGGGIPMAGGADRTAMTIHPSIAPVSPIASTALTSDHARYDVLADTMKRDTVEQLFKGANTARDSQNASMATSIQTYGQSAAAIRGAAEGQQLWNRLAADGLGPTGALSKQTGELADRTRDYGASVTTSAEGLEAELRLKKQIQDLEDTARSGFSGSLSSGIVAAAHGRNFGDAFKSGMSGLGDQLIGKGVSSITGGLLGQPGQGLGTGLLGGLFSGLPHFAGGTTDFHGGPAVINENGPETVVLPQHAKVLTADQTSGLMGGARAPMSVNMGDTHIHVAGDVSEGNRDMIAAAVARSKNEMREDFIRNMPQYQSDSRQGN
jgi:hypothetical protein